MTWFNIYIPWFHIYMSLWFHIYISWFHKHMTWFHIYLSWIHIHIAGYTPVFFFWIFALRYAKWQVHWKGPYARLIWSVFTQVSFLFPLMQVSIIMSHERTCARDLQNRPTPSLWQMSFPKPSCVSLYYIGVYIAGFRIFFFNTLYFLLCGALLYCRIYSRV